VARIGNEKLMEEKIRVGFWPADQKDEHISAICDAAADALARADICVVTLVDGVASRAAGTAAVRQAGPLILLGSKPLYSKGAPGSLYYSQPIPTARVWDEKLDLKLHLYVYGEGLKTCLEGTRRIPTHTLRVYHDIIICGPHTWNWKGSDRFCEEFVRYARMG
jgi:hypothetical protein